ncbi:MAG: hypothetical protein LH603_02820 [Pseudonocardia sp.]|nr:hypothetical protein [Pseudonocardia sp.]
MVEELGWTPSVDGTHVGVAVNDSAVALSGEVASYVSFAHLDVHTALALLPADAR